MLIRRLFAAVIATAALAGLGLTGAATAATPAQGVPSVVNDCDGGTYGGEQID
ncbi:hypothetical protein [Streptomyces virginiae]|uniref:hypothetical protein n=1 Tax=Streptomyces virginiae TaxID=1961 RepID=UPI003657AD4E